MKKIVVIGGGASGMACAVKLAQKGLSVTLLERGERLGKKLSATGNGQGNVTNFNMGAEHFFSDDIKKVARLLSGFGAVDTVRFLESMGGIFLPDTKGRVYPASRQASAVTDLFRRALEKYNVEVILGAKVCALKHTSAFHIEYTGGTLSADCAVLAAGGRAAPSFGTDGSAYSLATAFGHTVTECSPALVQLKTKSELVRGLKGIRTDGAVSVVRGGKTVFQTRGDVLFTDSGFSGDAIFRASSYARAGDFLTVDLLPDIAVERLENVIVQSGLLCVVNNGLARNFEARAKGNVSTLIGLLKRFSAPVTGTLGYQYAQVTKGGIPLHETDDSLQSRLCKGLYFTGEILNVDGECGGYNLQWAFTSAHAVAEAIK